MDTHDIHRRYIDIIKVSKQCVCVVLVSQKDFLERDLGHLDKLFKKEI